MKIRKAKPGDEIEILKLIKLLAGFEKAQEQVVNTAENLASDLFKKKNCSAIVVTIDNSIIAFALWYFSYSTWKGRCLYLEDIYVLPEHRNKGIGGKLFDEVVKTAIKSKVKRMDWQVLNWNTNAKEFYLKKKATLDDEWVNGRLFF